MPIESLLLFAGAVFVAAVIPGPGVLAIVGWALSQGVSKASGFLLGIILGDSIYLLLVMLGLSALASTMGEAFLVVKLGGAAYLVYLGVKMLRAKPTLEDGVGKVKQQRGGPILAGLALTLGNPKTMAFYVGILPGVIDLTILSRTDMGVLIVIDTAVLIVALLPYILVAARARRFMQSETASKRLNKTSGVILIGAGGAVAAS